MRGISGFACLLVLTLVACSGSDEPDVPSSNYSPTVKTRIDDAASDKDCVALQREFDTADANDSAQRNRTGEGNGDLLTYIDNAMKDASCYD